MRKMTFTLMFCVLLLLTISCKKSPTDTSSNTIIGSGNLVTEVRLLSSFHSVYLSTVGNVNISQGGVQEISITIDDNLLEFIRTVVSGGMLFIEVEPGHRFSNFNLTVNLTMTDLEQLFLSGAGSITGINTFKIDAVLLDLGGAGNISLRLESDQLTSSLTGAGNIILSGKVDTHQVNHSGAGNLLAFNLTTETTRISLSGAGKDEVMVKQLLEVNISGAGSVYYKGYPTIIQSITGAGNLIDSN